MSASLVGSEMCIRDRAPHRWREPSAGTIWSAASRSPEPTICVSGSAVSYTHLTLPTICSV
eukprot:13499330-Alexandrium_andersonii.AAC.1